MGLLDWLTSDISGGTTGVNGNIMSNMNPMGDQTGAPQPQEPAPLIPPTPSVNGGDPSMSASYSIEPKQPPPIPMPVARPQGIDMPAPGIGADPLPPPIDVSPRGAPDASMMPAYRPPQASGGAALPEAPLPVNVADAMASYGRAGGSMSPPPEGGAGGEGRTILGRALGLDPNSEKKLSSTLAAGFKAAGDSAGKSPFQALMGGAGAGLEGGNKADDKILDQQSKYLNDAIKAQQAGDVKGLNLARTQLALAQAKAVKEGKGTKDSVLNSKEQLYLRGIGAVNQDPKVKASAAMLREIGKGGTDTPEYKAAQKAHDELIDGTKRTVFSTLGVDEKAMKDIGKKPGFSSDNPVPKEGLTAQKFKDLPEGAYFINPKDGRLLIKGGQQTQGGGADVPAAPQSTTPAVIPPVQPAPAYEED